MDYFLPQLTGPEATRQYHLIFMLSQLTAANRKYLHFPDVCVNVLCDYLENQPVLTHQEYEAKYNIRLGYAKDYYFLKYIKKFEEEKNSLHGVSCEDLDNWATQLEDVAVMHWFNPQTVDILENSPFMTATQCIATLATQIVYQNSGLKDETIARFLSLLFQSPNFNLSFLENKDYDNNDQVDEHLRQALEKIIDESDIQENVDAIFLPNRRLQEFVKAGLYLNKTDHEKNNWALDKAKSGVNPYILLYLAQTHGLNIFQKNNQGQSAYDIIKQQYDLDGFLKQKEFPVLFNLQLNTNNLQPTHSNEFIIQERARIEQLIAQYLIHIYVNKEEVNFTQTFDNHLQNFEDEVALKLTQGYRQFFTKYNLQEKAKTIKAQHALKTSSFLNAVEHISETLKRHIFPSKYENESEEFFSSLHERETDCVINKESYLHYLLYKRYHTHNLTTVQEQYYHKYSAEHTLYERVDSELIEQLFPALSETSKILAFLYYNSHTSDTLFLECFKKSQTQDLVSHYQGYNILGLAVAQKRHAVVLELLKNPQTLNYIQTKWPEFATVAIKKLPNFEEIFLAYPQLLAYTNKDGDNCLHWATKHHHIRLLGSLIGMAPLEALTHKNERGIAALGYITYNTQTSEPNKTLAAAYMEKQMTQRTVDVQINKAALPLDNKHNPSAHKRIKHKI